MKVEFQHTLRDDSLPHQIRLESSRFHKGFIAVRCNCMEPTEPDLGAALAMESKDAMRIWRDHVQKTEGRSEEQKDPEA